MVPQHLFSGVPPQKSHPPWYISTMHSVKIISAALRRPASPSINHQRSTINQLQNATLREARVRSPFPQFFAFWFSYSSPKLLPVSSLRTQSPKNCVFSILAIKPHQTPRNPTRVLSGNQKYSPVLRPPAKLRSGSETQSTALPPAMNSWGKPSRIRAFFAYGRYW
jgi:hypothetical protein